MILSEVMLQVQVCPVFLLKDSSAARFYFYIYVNTNLPRALAYSALSTGCSHSLSVAAHAFLSFLLSASPA